jgi:hypothetical protein
MNDQAQGQTLTVRDQVARVEERAALYSGGPNSAGVKDEHPSQVQERAAL